MTEEFWNEVFEVNEDWEEPFEEKLKRLTEEKRSERIMEPTEKIIAITYPLLKELGRIFEASGELVQEAIDKIATNLFLIGAIYFRAVHRLSENMEEPIDDWKYWALLSSKKTFLAMKGFLWNLKIGCQHLARELAKYKNAAIKLLPWLISSWNGLRTNICPRYSDWLKRIAIGLNLGKSETVEQLIETHSNRLFRNLK